LINTKTFNTGVATAAIVVLSLFLWSYSETGSPPTLLTEKETKLNPTYYLANAKSSQFDENGALKMTIKNDFVEHVPEDNSSLLKQPRIALYRDGVLDWTIRSDTGVAFQTGYRIDLEQRVIIASGDNKMVLKTPFLSLYPDEKRIETDKPVTLKSPAGFTRAIGLEANLQTKQVHLLDQVRGQYNAVP
ncbi:MAG: LPS export ABC transporter periplasmic protein LptC, partial [Spongiibacteraceae bacterium]|nr:LPS export ABC transporter periplasmic protein LptC [Spongiibacteraceae bacterium]